MPSTLADCGSRDLEIAIIGMAGRFSGSSDLRQFWQGLLDGVEGISFFSDEELLASGIDAEKLRKSNYVKAAGILEGCELFDYDFFGITPKEAALMDPQHRVFLECAWQAFEDAGYVPEMFHGSIGVFAGAAFSSYFLKHVLPNLGSAAPLGMFLTSLSNDRDFMPMRVSYKLNLRGPSVSIGTACSTSLVAAHVACKSLLAGECDMALAGAASIHFPLKSGYLYEEGGILSPDGHCKTFDESAQGTVCGSGVAAVVLKRLEDAVASRDHIYAVIKGSAINNDGSQKIGFTAPSIDGQAEVIRAAHLMAGVSPETITYVEAHGTGTPIGDPIEVQALTEAFHVATSRKRFCAIGSVKTNIGHALEAAGVAGLIKVALALSHRKIPPSLHFSTPNPKLKIDESPFYINDKLQEWIPSGLPLRSGVSSFGIGGTNAHMVLEEAPPKLTAPDVFNCYLLTLSAKSHNALDDATAQLGACLTEELKANMADVAYTCHVGRKAFNYRRTLLCHDADDAIRALASCDTSRLISNDGLVSKPKVALLLSGEDILKREAIVELYRAAGIFREEVDTCLDLLSDDTRRDISRYFSPVLSGSLNVEQSDEDGPLRVASGALFIAQYALAQLWRYWGVEFHALVGDGIGELVAACLAGVLSASDALSIILIREHLVAALETYEKMPGPGNDRMSSLNRSGPSAEADPNGAHAIASGADSWRRDMIREDQPAAVDTAASRFLSAMQQIQLSAPKLPLISAAHGDWVTRAEACDPHFWTEQLKARPSRAKVLSKLLSNGAMVLLEIGAGEKWYETLNGQTSREKDKRLVILSSLPHVHENTSASWSLFSSVGRLWLQGWNPDWKRIHGGEQRSRISLPTYPFERALCRLPLGSRVELRDPVREANENATAISGSAQESPALDPLLSARAPSGSKDFDVSTELELQRRIIDIWRQLLGIEEIGLDDDFFELGGDSLLITRLSSRISEMLSVQLPLERIYDNPTVASIASAITSLLLETP